MTEDKCVTHYKLKEISKTDEGSKIILKAVDGKSPGLEMSIKGQLKVKRYPSFAENEMSKTIKAFGREHSLDDHATLFITVPDGETEAHVFVEGKLLGTRSAFEDGYLASMMKSAEDAAIARTICDAGLSLADVKRMVEAGVERGALANATIDGFTQGLKQGLQTALDELEAVHGLPAETTDAPDPRLSPLDEYPIDVEKLNKDINAFTARQVERELTSAVGNVTASYLETIPVATGPATGVVTRIDNLYSGAAHV